MYLNAAKTQSLARLMRLLADDYREDEIRRGVGEALLRLLDADYFASYVWSASERRYRHGVSIHMDPGNLGKYESYFQFRDPITHRLRERRGATLVGEIMPQASLERTEFFNDFLRRDGLKFGLNLHTFDGARALGDVRVWRGARGEAFETEERDLLALIEPALKAALVRAGRREGARIRDDALWGELTTREREICERLCRGLPDKAIAAELGIGAATVRTHLEHVFAKAGERGRTALIARLMRASDA